ncbi:uncharacterized protein KQ657_002491 [Scheffersomyces spartinae]|uniref:peptidylprolyl isomerase n=1 Tax=Scheffersomyces spartinae TaxID=45513 RepID=A0A9P7V6I0_9ASCO|nr:uncharacterized protein KQ657_002491 [Scheffersomyces spartinae]KAG7192126.1 hypothetical protein KQ657_002491 [Scheffersomyces spartinae]
MASNPTVFLDITIGTEKIGRIVLQLYNDLAPKAVTNFLTLINSHQYNGVYFHRVIKNFVVQAGDIRNARFDGDEGGPYPNPVAGKFNESSFEDEPHFNVENTTEPFDRPFKLAMANDGNPNSNGCQFFISTYPQPHLSGKYTIFGKVIHGKSVVRTMERVTTNSDDVPIQEQIITIADSGLWNAASDPIPIYNASYDPIGGDIYEEYPGDDEGNFDAEKPIETLKASEIIKESGTLLYKKGERSSAAMKYKKCLRYIAEFIPDEDQEPQVYKGFVDLKKKTYLNLSLVELQLKHYPQVIQYSDWLLELEGIKLTNQELAKAYYRRGVALLEQRKLENALSSLKQAHGFLPQDEGIKRDLERAETSLDLKKQKQKAKLATFFQ